MLNRLTWIEIYLNNMSYIMPQADALNGMDLGIWSFFEAPSSVLNIYSKLVENSRNVQKTTTVRFGHFRNVSFPVVQAYMLLISQLCFPQTDLLLQWTKALVRIFFSTILWTH